MRLAAHAVAAGSGGGGGPGAAHARRGRRRPWSDRRTSGTSRSTPSRCPSTGRCTSRPTWRSPTPSRWPRRWSRVRSTSRSSGRPTPSTAAAPPRWVTWPGTSSPSASTTAADDDDRPRRLRCERSAPRNRAAARPVTQIVLYAHLSADAITHVDNPDAPDEALCGRIEQAGHRLLSVEQIRAWCGRPDVQVVVNPGHRPARTPRVPRLQADPEDPRARHRPRRHVCVPVVRSQRPALRPRPHHPLQPRPPRAGRPDGDRQPRAVVQAAPPVEDTRAVALRDDRTRGVRLDQPARQHLPPRPHRQPTPIGRAWPEPDDHRRPAADPPDL